VARTVYCWAGRPTRSFASHRPYVSGDDPIAAKFNSIRKHIVSRTLDRVDWRTSTLIKGDVVEGIKKLKREPGNELQVHGSTSLRKKSRRDRSEAVLGMKTTENESGHDAMCV